MIPKTYDHWKTTPEPEHDPSLDDDCCPACGGAGVAEDECECMDDACCCLYPTPPVCSVCGGSGGHS